MQKNVIIVAGGSGSRVGGSIPKQFREINGKTVLWHSVKAFTEAYSDIEIILVLPNGQDEEGRKVAADFPGYRFHYAVGGDTRFESVKNGLALVTSQSLIFVHDAARCLVTPKLISHCAAVAVEKGNAIPAIPVSDSVRIEKEDGNEKADREKIRLIQTPQVFFSDVLKKAYQRSYKESFTDEASVVEEWGNKINLVEGESTNFKITTPNDLVLAEAVLKARTI